MTERQFARYFDQLMANRSLSQLAHEQAWVEEQRYAELSGHEAVATAEAAVAWTALAEALDRGRSPDHAIQKLREALHYKLVELPSVGKRVKKAAHKPKKSSAQLDAEIAHALTKRSKKPSPEVAALFAHLADIAESEGAENLSLAKRDEGYAGDPKEFRFSEIFARHLPTYKHERLVERIEECQQYAPTSSLDLHHGLGRALTEKEADWMRSEARKIYDEERRHIESALRESSP